MRRSTTATSAAEDERQSNTQTLPLTSCPATAFPPQPTLQRGYLGGAFHVSKQRWADRVAELLALIDTDLVRLSAAVARRSGSRASVRATVVGHSQGGALASLTALALAEAFPAWQVAACTFAAAPFIEPGELRRRMAGVPNLAAWVTLANAQDYFRDPRVFRARDFSGGLENWFSLFDSGDASGSPEGPALRVVRARGCDLGSKDVCRPTGPLRGALLMVETTPDVITRRVLGTLPAPAVVATAPASSAAAATPLSPEDLKSYPLPLSAEAGARRPRSASPSTLSSSSSDEEALSMTTTGSSGGGGGASSLESTLTSSTAADGEWAIVEQRSPLRPAAGPPTSAVLMSTPQAAAAVLAHDVVGEEEKLVDAALLKELLKDLAPSSHRAFEIGLNTVAII